MKYLLPLSQDQSIMLATDAQGRLETIQKLGGYDDYSSDYGRSGQGYGADADQGSGYFPHGSVGNPAEWDALPGDRVAGF